MTTEQLQALQDIEREICVQRVSGVDTLKRQARIYGRLRTELAVEVANVIIDKYPALSWTKYVPPMASPLVQAAVKNVR